MIVNEISLVIQKIFSVKQPKDQRFKVTEINQENDGVTNEMIWSLMKVQKRFVELREDNSSYFTLDLEKEIFTGNQQSQGAQMLV